MSGRRDPLGTECSDNKDVDDVETRRDDLVEVGVGVLSRATEDAREGVVRIGVPGTTDPAREIDGVREVSGGAGGSMAQPNTAVKIAVSEGCAREVDAADALGGLSSVGVEGSDVSAREDDGRETDEMMEVSDWTCAAVCVKRSDRV